MNITLTASDLACDSDDDCEAVWSGTVCSCGCNCPSTVANTAAYAVVASSMSLLPRDSSCTAPACGCPASVIGRCFAHQCTACGNPAFEPLPGQPAACTEDAGVSDAGASD